MTPLRFQTRSYNESTGPRLIHFSSRRTNRFAQRCRHHATAKHRSHLCECIGLYHGVVLHDGTCQSSSSTGIWSVSEICSQLQDTVVNRGHRYRGACDFDTFYLSHRAPGHISAWDIYRLGLSKVDDSIHALCSFYFTSACLQLLEMICQCQNSAVVENSCSLALDVRLIVKMVNIRPRLVHSSVLHHIGSLTLVC